MIALDANARKGPNGHQARHMDDGQTSFRRVN
jgi:hypothetical protein